ncbi:hypothetical protein GQX74_013147 [Glossina fuscipes]|nr:hypothetical protein GQX74_013147 [Glossina fuscipes]
MTTVIVEGFVKHSLEMNALPLSETKLLDKPKRAKVSIRPKKSKCICAAVPSDLSRIISCLAGPARIIRPMREAYDNNTNSDYKAFGVTKRAKSNSVKFTKRLPLLHKIIGCILQTMIFNICITLRKPRKIVRDFTLKLYK